MRDRWRFLIALGGLLAGGALNAGCNDSPSFTPVNNAAPSVLPPPPPSGPLPVANATIAFVTSRNREWQIYVANENGDVRWLTHGEQPAWSSDGRRIAFSKGGLYVVSVDGSNQRMLNGEGRSPTWSPDDSQIAFVRQDGVYVMNADGADVRRLVGSESPNYDEPFYAAAWSPDGRIIAFGAFNSPYYGLFVMNADGSEPRAVGQPYYTSYAPGRLAWSPDGSRLAFSSSGGITAVDRAGHEQLLVRSTNAQLWGPDWSPDGRHLVLSKATSPECAVGSCPARLFLVNLADGSMRQLIPDAVNPASPTYSDFDAAWSRVPGAARSVMGLSRF